MRTLIRHLVISIGCILVSGLGVSGVQAATGMGDNNHSYQNEHSSNNYGNYGNGKHSGNDKHYGESKHYGNGNDKHYGDSKHYDNGKDYGDGKHYGDSKHYGSGKYYDGKHHSYCKPVSHYKWKCYKKCFHHHGKHVCKKKCGWYRVESYHCWH